MPDRKDDKHKGKKHSEESKAEEKKKKEEAHPAEEEEQPHFSRSSDHRRKTLRFQLPVKRGSDESFSSALSRKEDENDYEDYSAPQVSVLKTFISEPLSHSQPRQVSKKTCKLKPDEAGFLASSSSELFQIAISSPSPSDANMNLIRATYMRKLGEVKEAIKDGANVNTAVDKQTPLLIATEIGDARLVAYLLTVPKVNPDFRNYFGQTPLIIAVRNAFDKIVSLLLHHKADVNIADHMGKTPLHGALFQERPKLAKLLITYGANVNQADCFGERPIYTCTVKKPNMECLLTLLKRGASLNYVNMSGIPLLSRVILNGTDESIIKALVEYGANVNARDLISRKTALHYAALQNKVKIIKYLCSNGANVNLQTTYHFTPLEEAQFQNSHEAAAYLEGLTDCTTKCPHFRSKFGRMFYD